MSDDIETTEETKEVSERMGDETAVYELGYHILSSVTDERLLAEVGNIKAVFEKKGGSFISEEFPITTHLAYTIEHNIGGKKEKYDTAYFGWVKFEVAPSDLNDIKKELDTNENILRFLIIHTVRENTRVSKQVLMASNENSDKPARSTFVKKEKEKEEPKTVEEPKTKDSIDEEIDRTIEELVVE